jgi:hypothetical protein
MHTPTFKPNERVITTRHGYGIVNDKPTQYGAAVFVQTRSGLIVADANTLTRDQR